MLVHTQSSSTLGFARNHSMSRMVRMSFVKHLLSSSSFFVWHISTRFGPLRGISAMPNIFTPCDSWWSAAGVWVPLEDRSSSPPFWEISPFAYSEELELIFSGKWESNLLQAKKWINGWINLTAVSTCTLTRKYRIRAQRASMWKPEKDTRLLLWSIFGLRQVIDNNLTVSNGRWTNVFITSYKVNNKNRWLAHNEIN